MEEPPAPDVEIVPSTVGLAALLGQLSSDAGAFARAETAYLKAQLGERASYALPALMMIAAGIALFSGSLIALLVGLMLVLAPHIGTGWAVASVTVGAILIGVLLLLLGTRRIKAALKKPELR